MVIDSIKKKKVIIAFLGILLLIYTVPCFFLNTPYFIDGVNTLSLDFFMQGYDWKNYLQADGYYYKYGLALIYLPIFFVIHNPSILYKTLLIVNGILSLSVPYFSLKICRKYFHMDMKISLAISGVIGILPFFVLNIKHTWAEVLLIILPWILLYLIMNIYDNIQTGNEKAFRKNIFLSSLFSAYAYMAHSRGIVILLTTIIVIGYIIISEKKYLKEFIFFLLVILGLCYLDLKINGWIRENIFPIGEFSQNSSIGSVFNKEMIGIIFSINGLKTIIRIFCGWIYNISVSSFGLVILGLIEIIFTMFSILKKRKVENKQYFIVITFIELFFIGAFILGALFFLKDIMYYYAEVNLRRSDKLLYGRYIEPSAMMLSFLGIYVLLNKLNKYKRKISIILFGLVTLFFCYDIAERLNNVSTWTHNLVTINGFADLTEMGRGFVTVENYSAPLITIGVISLAIFSMLIIFRNKLKYNTICGIYIIIFLCIGFRGITNVLIPEDKYYMESTHPLSSLFEQIDGLPAEYKVIYLEDELIRCAYQFQFPDFYVVTQRDQNRYTIENMFIVSETSLDTLTLYLEEYYEITDCNTTSSWKIYVKGKQLNELLNQKGISTQKVTFK